MLKIETPETELWDEYNQRFILVKIQTLFSNIYLLFLYYIIYLHILCQIFLKVLVYQDF